MNPNGSSPEGPPTLSDAPGPSRPEANGIDNGGAPQSSFFEPNRASIPTDQPKAETNGSAPEAPQPAESASGFTPEQVQVNQAAAAQLNQELTNGKPPGEVIQELQSMPAQVVAEPSGGNPAVIENPTTGGTIPSQEQPQPTQNGAENPSAGPAPEQPAQNGEVSTGTAEPTSAEGEQQTGLTDQKLLETDLVKNFSESIRKQKETAFTSGAENPDIPESLAKKWEVEANTEALKFAREHWMDHLNKAQTEPESLSLNEKIEANRALEKGKLYNATYNKKLDEYDAKYGNNGLINPVRDKQTGKLIEGLPTEVKEQIEKEATKYRDQVVKEWGWTTDPSENIPDKPGKDEYGALLARVDTVRQSLVAKGDKTVVDEFDKAVLPVGNPRSIGEHLYGVNKMDPQEVSKDYNTVKNLAQGIKREGDLDDKALFVRTTRLLNKYDPPKPPPGPETSKTPTPEQAAPAVVTPTPESSASNTVTEPINQTVDAEIAAVPTQQATENATNNVTEAIKATVDDEIAVPPQPETGNPLTETPPVPATPEPPVKPPAPDVEPAATTPTSTPEVTPTTPQPEAAQPQPATPPETGSPAPAPEQPAPASAAPEANGETKTEEAQKPEETPKPEPDRAKNIDTEFRRLLNEEAAKNGGMVSALRVNELMDQAVAKYPEKETKPTEGSKTQEGVTGEKTNENKAQEEQNQTEQPAAMDVNESVNKFREENKDLMEQLKNNNPKQFEALESILNQVGQISGSAELKNDMEKVGGVRILLALILALAKFALEAFTQTAADAAK